MLRTALGESTASLDSTVRSGPPGALCGHGEGRRAAPRAHASFVASAPLCVPPSGVARVSLCAWRGCPSTRTRLWVRARLGGQSCATPPPARAGALSPTSPLSRDEGGQKLSVSSGPARGGHGEPDASFVPRSAKKPHGTCLLGGGLPFGGAGCPEGPLPWPGPRRLRSALDRKPPAGPSPGHDSDSDSELSLDEQSSSYASSHSSDSEDDGGEAEDKWDPAQGPVHSTPKGERAPGRAADLSCGLPPPGRSCGGKHSPLPAVRRGTLPARAP